MLKYTGDLVEKLVAGALFAGLFQDNKTALVCGLLFCGAWYILRLLALRIERRKGQ